MAFICTFQGLQGYLSRGKIISISTQYITRFFSAKTKKRQDDTWVHNWIMKIYKKLTYSFFIYRVPRFVAASDALIGFWYWGTQRFITKHFGKHDEDDPHDGHRRRIYVSILIWWKSYYLHFGRIIYLIFWHNQ